MALDAQDLLQLGKTITDALSRSGAGGYYSAATPSGGEATMAGRAGGRGEVDSTAAAIKATQLHTKATKRVIQDYKDLTKLLQKNKDNLKDTTKNIEVFGQAFSKKWDAVMDQVAESAGSEAKIRKKLSASLGKNFESLESLLELREEQLTLERKIREAEGYVNDETLKNVERYREISEALNEATNEVEDFGENMQRRGASFVKAFFSVEAAMANLTVAVTQLYNDFSAQLQFGSSLGIWANQWEAIMAGVDPAQFSEMMASARGAQMAFGSAREFAQMARSEAYEMFRFTGDMGEAMNLVMNQYQLLAESGIRPTVGATESLADTFRFLNKTAGVTAQEFQGMMEGLLQETDIREKLRAAKDSERAAIVAGIGRQIEMNRAMGMTVEQALEAAKSLGRLAGEDARDRFKRAAQVQMMMGGMGIAGGGEAAELIRLGQRRTAEQNQELQGYMSQIANEAVQSRRGGYGAEMMVDTMMERTGMGQYLGKDSPFVTTMTDALKPTEQQLELARHNADRDATWQEEMLMWTKLGANFVANGALGKMLVGIAQLIGAIIIGKAAIRALPGLAAGAAGAAGSVAAVGAALTGAGVAGYAAGTAIYGAIDETRAGIALSESVGKLTDAIIMYTGVGDEEAAEQRMMLRVAQETRDYQEQQLRIAEREAEENKLQTTMLETANALMEGRISQEEYNTRMRQMATTGQPISLAE